MKVYFDMDGVLADFDGSSRVALNTDNPYKWEFVHGTQKFWEILDAVEGFWDNLSVLPGIEVLQKVVASGNEVAILTALPKTGADAVKASKEAWIRKYVGDIEVVACLTDEKPNYSGPGIILVDDRNIQKEPWEAAGGSFVLYQNASDCFADLYELGAITSEEAVSYWKPAKRVNPRDSKLPTLNTA